MDGSGAALHAVHVTELHFITSHGPGSALSTMRPQNFFIFFQRRDKSKLQKGQEKRREEVVVVIVVWRISVFHRGTRNIYI